MSTIEQLLEVSSASEHRAVIEFLPIRATTNLSEEITEILAAMKTVDSSCQPIKMHLSGHFNTEIRDTSDFPICFYRQLGIDWTTANCHYFVPVSLKGHCLKGLLKYIPYIFIHDISSTGSAEKLLGDVVNKQRDEFFLVNPEKNMYAPGHVFYGLAEQFLREARSLTLIDFKGVIEGAAELHMITSSFFCFAAGLLGVRAKVKVAYARNRDRFPTIAGDWTYIDLAA